MKDNILYSRLKLPSLPTKPHINISDETYEIYYTENDEKVVITKLEEYNLKIFKKYIKPILMTDGEWINIILEIDTSIFKCPEILTNRKLFFSIMKQCYQQRINEYISHMAINLIENTINKQKLDDVPWMVSKEFGKLKNFYQYPDNTIKLSDYYIDIENGIIYSKSKSESINIRGGIVIDKTNNIWIDKIKCLIDTSDSKLDTNLIICSQNTIQQWKSKFPDSIIITDKRQHKKVTYNNISNSNVVIVSNEYLMSKGYEMLWDNFKINQTLTINEIFNIMKKEFMDINMKDIINNFNFPIFSLIKWKRLIIDSFTMGILSNDNQLNNMINTIESSNRWVQLAGFPSQINNLINTINIISGKIINYPIYKSNGSVHYLNDIIRCISDKQNIIKFNKLIVKVNTNKYEKILSQLKLSDSEINDLIFNFKAKSEIKKIIKKDINCCDMNECSICLNKINKEFTTVTKCGHHYCLECITENLKFSSGCPLCRESIDYKNIYTIVPSSFMLSKVTKLISLLKDSNNKNIIYVDSIKEAEYVSNCMNKKGISNVICSGRTNNKKNIIVNDFNKGSNIKNIIMQHQDHCISANVRHINSIYFLNMNTDMININNYCGYSYLNKEIDTMMLYQFKLIKFD